MAEKKYYWLKLPRNFFGKHYIKILRAKENGELLVLFYMWMLTEAIDHEGRLRYSEDIPYDEEMLAEASGVCVTYRYTSVTTIYKTAISNYRK